MDLPTGEQAAFFTIAGAALAKVIDSLIRAFSKSKDRDNAEESQFRKDLREDRDGLRKQVAECTRERDLWRDRYYTLRDAGKRDDWGLRDRINREVDEEQNGK